MALAIVSFIVETLFLCVVKVGADSHSLDRGFIIFAVVVILICTITSTILIPYNAKRIKDRTVSKGVSITGLIFSIETAVTGLIFLIAFLAGLAIASAAA